MIKKIAFTFIFLVTLSIFGQQEKINNYKYVVVPIKLDFLKGKDQYQTSSLTKFLLQKKGFTVFLSNENMPSEIFQNKCSSLTANVIDDSRMFTIKSQIELKDCYGTVLYKSRVGKSKEKDYKKSYQEAIRNAYASMTDLKYSYQPLKKTIIKKEIVKNIITEDTVEIKKVSEINEANSKTSVSENILYAQVTANGFQLVNKEPVVVFQVLKTNVKDVYILKNKKGILYKNTHHWIVEYYQNNILIMTLS